MGQQQQQQQALWPPPLPQRPLPPLLLPPLLLPLKPERTPRFYGEPALEPPEIME